MTIITKIPDPAPTPLQEAIAYIRRHRRAIEAEVEFWIAALDLADGDPDEEDTGDLEADTSDDEPWLGASEGITRASLRSGIGTCWDWSPTYDGEQDSDAEPLGYQPVRPWEVRQTGM